VARELDRLTIDRGTPTATSEPPLDKTWGRARPNQPTEAAKRTPGHPSKAAWGTAHGSIFEFFQHRLPLDRSSMTNWRNRMTLHFLQR
jgi:hypothetical protein